MTEKNSLVTQAAVCFFLFSAVLSAAVVYAAEAPRIALDEVESFTDRINALTQAMEAQKLELDKTREALELLEAAEAPAGGDTPAASPEREALERKINDLEKSYRENEQELETYSARIQESHGYAPKLLGTPAISKTGDK